MNKELEKGFSDLLKGTVKPGKQVFNDIFKNYDIDKKTK